jgi:hypothetical protein
MISAPDSPDNKAVARRKEEPRLSAAGGPEVGPCQGAPPSVGALSAGADARKSWLTEPGIRRAGLNAPARPITPCVRP